MPSITIRDIPTNTKESLRVKAAKAGVSLESYARQVLQQASISSEQLKGADLLSLSRKYFEEDGVELDLPVRSSNRKPVDFE